MSATLFEDFVASFSICLLLLFSIDWFKALWYWVCDNVVVWNLAREVGMWRVADAFQPGVVKLGLKRGY